MQYDGPTRHVRVRIVATTGPWAEYNGQECDALFYRPDMSAQINSEQLKPPLPKWQSAKLTDLQELP